MFDKKGLSNDSNEALSILNNYELPRWYSSSYSLNLCTHIVVLNIHVQSEAIFHPEINLKFPY